ncbi:hypothetical protein FB45DRAFT_396501 [Roridomyces roridus]|uniref:P-loop containing nucleoside triphosphate hydrolase protein n=1 Tax=Roridomyces roridus TaxID=1738132 RepID=A0AAD7AWC6_9AGAR|nr:hypothetical protein FB45DRAFT_396501 [Roridomyces roridus]
MEALRSLVSPLGLLNGTSVVDGVKLVVLGGTVETARRVSSSAWSHFVNSFFLTAHFSEEDHPYDWLMLWLSRRPEWQRSREFETTTRAAHAGASGWGDELDDPLLASYFPPSTSPEDPDELGPSKTRVHFQPTLDSTHTIYWRQHWLRVRRSRGEGGQMLSVSVVARSNAILKALVLTAKREYEREAVHRIQIFLADPHGSWRWADARHKRPMGSIVLDPGVKEMLLGDARDFLASEKWYADRGIPFRRGYLLHGVPGSGKSSLIHAIAGELMLDVYVVSLSSAWISDTMLMGLMSRVPKGAILLLEDLDAAFRSSASRRSSSPSSSASSSPPGTADQKRRRRDKERDRERGYDAYDYRGRDVMSEMNTLSLSGLLNALDGVAAAEGRILFATTNHLEKLDPALSRPGRMDVWVEFKNASRWQAEALFRNFFPSAEDEEADDIPLDEEPTSAGASTASLWSTMGSVASSSRGSSGSGTGSEKGKESSRSPPPPPMPMPMTMPQFGSSNEAYLPPPVAAEIAAAQHTARPLDARTLAALAKRFADAVPEGEFSVAALQGYLLKNKSRPEAASNEAAAWVVSEREMRERLEREKEARETKEKMEREKRKRERAEKAAKKETEEREKKEKEKEKAKAAAAAASVIPVVPDAATAVAIVTATTPLEATTVATSAAESVTSQLASPTTSTESTPAVVVESVPAAPSPPSADASAIIVDVPVVVPDTPTASTSEPSSESDSEDSDDEDEDDDVGQVVRQQPRRISPWAAPIRPGHGGQWHHPPPAAPSWGSMGGFL